MKKIMFSDEFMLTKAVLEGRKTQTRRIVPKSLIDKYEEWYNDVCCIAMPSGSTIETLRDWLLRKHKKYIAVNPLSGIKEDDGMFCPHNCDIYRMTTGEFLNTIDYPKEKVFVICNYVPNWHGEDSMELVRKNFKNCYTFYPD